MNRTILLASLFAAACSPGEEGSDNPWDGYFADGGYLRDAAHSNVIREFAFTAEVEKGVAYGFDLDGVSSPDGDNTTCGHGDLKDPEGREGIDNQFARVWKAVQPIIGEQVEELLQGSINEGRFLMMIELEGADDLWNDDDVTLRLFRGSADPEIGTFDLISPDQTFYVDPSITVSTLENVQIKDGVIEAGPVAFDLPIDILEANFIMPVEQGQLRFEIQGDGTFRGIIGGAVHVQNMLDELLATDAAEEVAAVAPLFQNAADLENVGGTCTKFSTAFGFEGTTAFVVHYDE